MKLKDLLPECDLEIEVSGIEIDSRLVKPGSIFFALKGANFDGAEFLDSAFMNGAVVAVVSRHSSVGILHNIVEVDDVYSVLVSALQKFYSDLPENILAITGTNGKTSTACFIQQLQEILGKKSASIGTIGIKCSDLSIQNQLSKFDLTTPDIVSLYKNLSILKKNGINDISIEASSIGLEQKRMAGLKIGLGAFTNFSQDHLDYHGSMEKYFECKILLFKETVCDGGIAVLNADLPEFERIKEIAKGRNLRVFEYTTKNSSIIISEKSEIQSDLQNLPDFQKANLLCALTSVIAYYQPSERQIEFLINNLDKIKPAEGRMQLVATLKNNAKIFIDFAHTPDALQNVLSNAKKMPHNRLVILFGCGGDRDKGKRPQMGKIACELADSVIITDDNPRTENAKQIRKDILSACNLEKTIEIANRQTAIEQAISTLGEDDILIMAGKGHEKYQIIGEEKLPFDEEKIVNEIMNK